MLSFLDEFSKIHTSCECTKQGYKDAGPIPVKFIYLKIRSLLLCITMSLNLKMTTFWEIVSCSPIEVDRRFRDAYYLVTRQGVFHIII
jgi:hypothetical protein